jgi:hypothetical protein
VLEDALGTIRVDHKIYDFATADGIPCCAISVDSTDAMTICVDSTGSDNLYYQRDTYDCGSNYDLGVATDILVGPQFDMEDSYIDNWVCIPYDSTSPGIIIDNIDVVGSPVPFSDSTAVVAGGYQYTHIQTGGMADYDYGGTFDCIGGMDLCVIEIYRSSSSSSVSSSSSSLSSSSSSSSSSFSVSSSSSSFSFSSSSSISSSSSSTP